jgi:ABC-type branched-subunit amino acid transport system substrate-binding protein
MPGQIWRIASRPSTYATAAAAVLLVAGLAGCGDKTPATSGTEPTYTVGVVLQLSGTGSVYAEAAQAGIKAGVTDVNNRHVAGATLATDVADAGADANSVTTACSRLIQKDSVKAIVAFVPGPQLIACNAVAKSSNIPVLSLSSGAGNICAPNLVSLGLVPNQQTLPIVDYLVGQGKTKWYFFGADYSTPKNTFAIAEPHLKSGGGTVVGESFEPIGTSDYSQDITKIVNAHPDVAFLNVIGNDDVALQKQWAADPRTAGIERVDILLGEGTAKALGAAANGIWSSSAYFSSITGTANDQFKAAVKAAGLNSSADINTYISYMQIETLAAAVKKGGVTNSAGVIQALGATSTDGPVGTFAIHKAFSFQPVYLAKAGADGGFTIAKKTDPAEPQLSCPPSS